MPLSFLKIVLIMFWVLYVIVKWTSFVFWPSHPIYSVLLNYRPNSIVTILFVYWLILWVQEMILRSEENSDTCNHYPSQAWLKNSNPRRNSNLRTSVLRTLSLTISNIRGCHTTQRQNPPLMLEPIPSCLTWLVITGSLVYSSTAWCVPRHTERLPP